MPVLTESELLARISDLRPRGGDTHLPCCLLAYLKIYGYRGELARILPAAPLPISGASTRLSQFLARRLGLALLPLSTDCIGDALSSTSVLLMRADGDTTLLLGASSDAYTAWLPEQPGILTHLTAQAVVGATAWAIERTGTGMLLNRRPRAPRFWLLDNYTEVPTFDRAVLRRLVDTYLADAPSETEPVEITELSVTALLHSHASIAPSHPQYFGQFRHINLRPEAGFVDARHVPALIQQLLEKTASYQAEQTHDPLVLAAKVFSDYLTLHPFLNGNRRLGMALVSAVLARDGYRLDWDAITLTECYYMVRCAARGHLEDMVMRMRRVCSIVGPSPQQVIVQTLARQSLPTRIMKVLRTLRHHGFSAWLVGGAVRDLLAGVVPADFDIVTNAGSADIFGLFDNAHIVGGRFQLVVVMLPGGSVEVSTVRDGCAPLHGLLSSNAHLDASLIAADAALRDFTVNALYYDPIDNILLNPTDGMADLAAHSLRTIGDPAASFAADPLRALRGIRHAVRLCLVIEPATMEALCNVKTTIMQAASGRLARELSKLLKSGNMLDALNIMFVTHLLAPLLPGVHCQMFDQRTKDFLHIALARGDHALSQGVAVAPAYFLAVLLWADVHSEYPAYREKFGAELGWQLAVDELINRQKRPIKTLLENAPETRHILSLQPLLDCNEDQEELRRHRSYVDAWRLLDARRLACYG